MNDNFKILPIFFLLSLIYKGKNPLYGEIEVLPTLNQIRSVFASLALQGGVVDC
jgi:hypothetical protein